MRVLLPTLLLAISCQDKAASEEPLPDQETDCTNGLDDDGDGKVDCADAPDCTVQCQATTETACSDGLDDDADGAIDCADPDCATAAVCTEICDNGVDDDGDGAIDCTDADCEGARACQEDCTDGRDNDRDGLVDCADDDCDGVEGCVEDCDNGVDDDDDGDIDCADDDCPEACLEDCTNGEDDDGDSLIDCEDGDCATHSACTEDCDNGEDDDDDGAVDCDDEDCWGNASCEGQTLLVRGGELNLRVTSFYSGGFNWSSFTFSTQRGGAQATITDPSGVLRIERSGTALTCGWSADLASFSGDRGAPLDLVNRSGFRTSGACGGASSALLPTRLIRDGSALKIATGSQPIWYGGVPTFSTSTSFSTSTFYSSFSFAIRRSSTASWTVPSVQGGPWVR